jgi:dynein heavy chain 2
MSLSQVPDSLTAEDLVNSSGYLPVIQTGDVKRQLDFFNSWLQPNNRQPFILVGPEGCGKE